jgi:uncharacterized damage-inducible protein DinB
MWQSLSPMLNEFHRECATTRRVLDRVPADKLDWPHSKSMTIGKLANHIAGVPGGISRIAQNDVHQLDPTAFSPAQPKDKAEILEAFESSKKTAEQFIENLTEGQATAIWRLKAQCGDEILAVPRIELIRNIMFNHLYHHRGQLSVYLRLLDVPVPSIYGPSADENPFN